MNSRIYMGKVMHARRNPVDHRWVFPFYFYALDLDELPELDRRVRGFGFNHWQPVCLREQDYLRGSGPFREQLSEFIDVGNIDRIILVTVARFMSRVFNPVSFYYCLRADGSPTCMVAEVNNTFRERHLYILDGGTEFPVQCRHDKQFHVSPFNSMEGHYEFSFSKPGNNLNIEIRLVRNNAVIMDAAMWGTGKPLTTGNLWKTILRHPFTAGLTMPRIIWQAALLHYKRKLPVFPKPAPTSNMTIKENV
jgi:cyclopropane-fatty-acyl-phospholipid synthase